MDTDRDEPVISGNVSVRFGENLDKLGRGATLIALGTRERIALIDIKGKQFLIGVTTQQINHLHTFEEAVIPMNDKPNNFKQGDFVTKLQTILNSGKIDKSQDTALSTATNSISVKASSERNTQNKDQGNNVL